MTTQTQIPATIRPTDLMGTADSEPDSAPGRQKFPGVDGLRGTAILLVLICHYSMPLSKLNGLFGFFENGWAGVDLFFVISGFLITGILFDAKGTAHYFRNFYARRVLRIFPLYYGFLAILLLLTLKFSAWHAHGGIHDLWRSQPWLWTYTANFWIATQKQWNEWISVIIPLWSLSVEEQFYLIWPFVIFSFSHRALIRICLAIMICALLLRLILGAGGTNWFALYTWTPTRADSLAAGALVALLIRQPDGYQLARRISIYAGAISGLLLIVLFPGFDPTRHPWQRDLLYSTLATFFAAILFWSIDAASLRGFPKRFYELRLLRAIGGYSYGIYIFHLPLIYLARIALMHSRWYSAHAKTWVAAFVLIASGLAFTSAAAFISFQLYEKQFLKLKRFFPESALRASQIIRRDATSDGIV